MDHRRRTSSLNQQPGQAPKALLILWDDDTEPPGIPRFKDLLSKEFGYGIVPVSLLQSNPERLLAEEINSALDNQSGVGRNPVIIYYYGGGFSSDGRLYWRPKADVNECPSVDWLRVRQQHIDPSANDVLVIIDCNHGRISTSPQRTPFLEQRLGQGGGKLEILTAPQLAAPYRPQFTRILVESLGDLSRSNQYGRFTIMSLKAVMQKAFDTKKPIQHYNLTPPSDQSLIQLEVHLSAFQNGQSTTAGLASPYTLTAPTNASNIPDYQNVVVLPITWSKVIGWNAEEELSLLLDAFRNHFDYDLKDIIKIPAVSQPQAFLQAQIQNHTSKLGSRDLLIVLYNGHATDAYKNNGRMTLSGDAMGEVSVDWTELVHGLNLARCDVVHILDCCYAAGGTKGYGETTQAGEDFYQAANSATKSDQVRGKNETLAACGRETRAPAGESSSMRLFANVLNELASERNDFSIDDWYHHIDAEVGRAVSSQKQRWYTPYRKMNPVKYAQSSIRLRTKLYIRY